MRSKAFEKIADGLKAAIAFAEGDKTRAKIFSVPSVTIRDPDSRGNRPTD